MRKLQDNTKYKNGRSGNIANFVYLWENTNVLSWWNLAASAITLLDCGSPQSNNQI